MAAVDAAAEVLAVPVAGEMKILQRMAVALAVPVEAAVLL